MNGLNRVRFSHTIAQQYNLAYGLSIPRGRGHLVTAGVTLTVKEVKGKKVVVSETLSALGQVCATGRVVAVQMPEDMLEK